MRVLSIFRVATVAGAMLSAHTVSAQMTPGAPKSALVYAIRNATVVPVSGPRMVGGTVIVQNGRIAAVGTNVTVPVGATVIDGTGMFVYPGFIDSGTHIGLGEIESVPGGEDEVEIGTFNPHNVALTAVNPLSELIPVARFNGITTAVTAPSGGLVSGTASLIDLSGWTGDQMAVRRSAGLIVNFPTVGGARGGRGGGRGGAGGATDSNEQVRQLTEYFRNAKAYADIKARLAAGGAGKQAIDLPMEAMVPAMRGEMPVVFDANSVGQIRGALVLADSFHLKAIIRGGREAYRLADTLAARKVPVVLGPIYAEPNSDAPYDEIFAAPAVLVKAGVMIAFQTNSASSVRDLPFEVALCEAFGLSADDAIRAITLNAATIWGVADRVGSIDAGKIANLFVSTGDPMDPRSSVKYLFIRGEQVPLVDRHTKLYEQFRARPKQAKPPTE